MVVIWLKKLLLLPQRALVLMLMLHRARDGRGVLIV